MQLGQNVPSPLSCPPLASPGGTTDITTRLIAEKLGAKLGQTIIVENRAGAAGIIGAQQLARSPADGYTLIMGNIGPKAINYSLYKKTALSRRGFFVHHPAHFRAQRIDGQRELSRPYGQRTASGHP